jgi:hypothetical protein
MNNETFNRIKPMLKNIFQLLSSYQSQIEQIQIELHQSFKKQDLNVILQQTFYLISNDKPSLTLGDFYRYLKYKKIYFNLPNLRIFFNAYDIDNDSFLSIKEFSNLFNFSVIPFKFIAKFEENSIFNKAFINILSKNLEMFEMINSNLKNLYSIEKSFIPDKLFYTISIENDEITVEQIKNFLQFFGINSNKKAKDIFMKINCNTIDNNITLFQFSKFFILQSKIANDILKENSILDAIKINEIINNAINKTKEENYGKLEKIENDMFNAFIKFLIEKDTKLTLILSKENLFNPATLFNYITPYNQIPLDDFAKRLKTLFGIEISKKAVDIIYERYSKGGYNMDYNLFNKFIGVNVKETNLNDSSHNYNDFSKNLKDKIINTIKIAITNEIQIEDFRQKLNRMSHFNTKNIFNNISKDGVNIINLDLEDFFGINKFQSNLLIRRFDVDEDGKISYDDVRYFL